VITWEPGWKCTKKPYAVVYTKRGVPIKRILPKDPKNLEYCIWNNDFTGFSALTDREYGADWNPYYTAEYPPKVVTTPRTEVFNPDKTKSRLSGGGEVYWVLMKNPKGLKLGLETRKGFLEDLDLGLL